MKITALLVAISCFSVSAYGANLYRYTDAKGVRVTADTIPPQAAELGYEVVTQTGRVVSVVAPTPKKSDLPQGGDATINSHDDQYLLTSFSAVEEISNLKERKLKLLKLDMENLQQNLQGLFDRERALHTEASNLELSGRTVSDALKKRLQDVREEQLGMQRVLQDRQEEYRQIEQKYDGYILRFRELQAGTVTEESPSLAEASSL